MLNPDFKDYQLHNAESVIGGGSSDRSRDLSPIPYLALSNEVVLITAGVFQAALLFLFD